MQSLQANIAEVEHVSAMGGFFYKPWIISGVSVSEQVIGHQLPDLTTLDEEKALGVHWDVCKDVLYVKADLLSIGKKRGKSDVCLSVCDDGPVKIVVVKPHMSLRICLSLHARTYDPLGWVLPLRMHGNLLFRETLQFLKKDKKGGIP